MKDVNIEDAIQFVDMLKNHLISIKASGNVKVSLGYEITNTGIASIPDELFTGYADLGGRSIVLEIITPNTKTLQTALKERDDK